MSGETVLDTAREVLRIEAEALLGLRERLDQAVETAVERMLACRGKVVVTGIGKSGDIAKKVASTLASTGTPAFFLHPTEGVHGDLGMLTDEDLVLALSNSGETDELTQILPAIKRLGVPLIAVTGNPASTLGRAADIVLPVIVKEEACPLGLAPTASTTAALALGDALAIALLKRRGFREEDFAARHPGGRLGKRLFLTVADLMHGGDAIPLVEEGTPMRDALLEMTSKRLGVTGVRDAQGRLVGVITDGDLRRALARHEDLLARRAGDVMTTHPKTMASDTLAVAALRFMEDHAITLLFIWPRDDPETIVGVVHMHDLVRAGIV